MLFSLNQKAHLTVLPFLQYKSPLFFWAKKIQFRAFVRFTFL